MRQTRFKHAKAVQDTYIVPQNARVAFAAEAVTQELADLVSGVADPSAGPSGERSVARPRGEPQPAKPRAVHYVELENYAAELSMQCRVAKDTWFTDDILEEVLYEALNDALRVEMGATYGVSVSITDEPHGTTLQVASTTPPSAVKAATTALFDTLASIADGSLEQGDLNRHKLAVALSTSRRWQSNAALANWLMRLMVFDLEPGDMDAAQAIHDITLDSLQEALAPCVGHESVVWSGPVDAMEKL